jgi:hypothetical protein
MTELPINRGIIRRKDLDIHELLNICSAPTSKEDRITILQDYAKVYPELKYFLVVAYFCKDAFKSITEIAPIEFIPSKVHKGSSIENITSMWREITKMYDSFPTGPRVRRGKAQRLLEELYYEDAKLVHLLLTGKYYSKELNESVVVEAFPLDIPAPLKKDIG